jgi:hypothetical protein
MKTFPFLRLFRALRAFRAFALAALLAATLAGCTESPISTSPPTAPSDADWQPLFNGKDLAGWRSVKGGAPAKGWSVAGGVLTLKPKSGAGDIVTKRVFGDFEFYAEFRLTPRANSGIKYLVQTDADKNPGVGPEFQLYDDTRPGARNDGTNYYEIGSLYTLSPSRANRPVLVPGTWRTARIVVSGAQVTHYLDGQRVATYDRHSADFRARVAKTKFKNVRNYGEWPAGHILLQDHGCEVSFRNIKIRSRAAR